MQTFFMIAFGIVFLFSIGFNLAVKLPFIDQMQLIVASFVSFIAFCNAYVKGRNDRIRKRTY